MKTFFKELFEYNFNFNQKTLYFLAENQEQISDKLIRLLSHMVNVHGIWNSRILSTKINYKPWDTFSVKELIEIDNANFNSSISIMEKFDLAFEIQYSTFNGKPYNNTIRDILFQIINHSTYHRGQIATVFRECDMKPLLTDWIFYKMN
ncbi:damage-inducible protein DinB [Sphingobacterium sp. SRCM116780]|uniref:DinB family protein n=1 Tax=Sphingobacterium sp. SRCM116780 TaxID=2907623 RepID=UPI001F2EACE1|nr:DinB family protein [Sphingobacterium sp. SRCM116780]UIR55353.1 damage-inducible protein DinB [Sphingobacterium sp. SRCM116780]